MSEDGQEQSLHNDRSEDELFQALMFGELEKDILPGHSYLVEEKKPQRALSIFKRLLQEGYDGIYVTRQHPDHVSFSDVESPPRVIWLSTTLGENYVDPHNLGSLTNIINTFIDEHPNSVVLLDGLEYLLLSNDYPRVLRFIEYLNELAMDKKTILIVSVDDRAYSPRDLALLERTMVLL